jgi:hypothetical protein
MRTHHQRSIRTHTHTIQTPFIYTASCIPPTATPTDLPSRHLASCRRACTAEHRAVIKRDPWWHLWDCTVGATSSGPSTATARCARTRHQAACANPHSLLPTIKAYTWPSNGCWTLFNGVAAFPDCDPLPALSDWHQGVAFRRDVARNRAWARAAMGGTVLLNGAFIAAATESTRAAARARSAHHPAKARESTAGHHAPCTMGTMRHAPWAPCTLHRTPCITDACRHSQCASIQGGNEETGRTRATYMHMLLAVEAGCDNASMLSPCKHSGMNIDTC